MAGSGNNTRNPQNANDNYPAAALRHFHDAEILRDADAYENVSLCILSRMRAEGIVILEISVEAVCAWHR